MIVKHLTGIILLIIHWQTNPASNKKIGECDVEHDALGKIAANCNNKGIKKIPRDLGGNIEVLDISNNDISVFKANDLKNYSKLKTLIMQNLSVTSFPENFFNKISQLIKLNMSNSQISNLKEIPGTVTILDFANSKSEYVDVSHLIFLEELYMGNSNALKKIPTLHKEANLRILDLENCALTEANYSQIAPFCLLEYFGCNSIELRKEQYVNQCCGLRKWAEKQNIKDGYLSQGCNDSGSDYSVCNTMNIVFDENSLNEYNACYQNRMLKMIVAAVLGIFILSLVATLIAVLGQHLYEIYVKSEGDVEAENDEDADAIPEKKDTDGTHEKKLDPKKKLPGQEESAAK